MNNKKRKIINAFQKKKNLRARVEVKSNLRNIVESTEEIERVLKNLEKDNLPLRRHLDINDKTGEYAYGIAGDIIASYINSEGNKYQIRIQYIKE